MALKLSVIGTGYLGATHAACMASLGFEVIGFDTESSKIDLLSKGKVPFYEPDLEELLAEQIKAKRLTFTNRVEDLSDADVHFICVGTPQIKNGNAADLTYVNSALESIAKHVKPGGLVVGKSTVPVGTATKLRSRLLELNPKADLAWNPEFLREGFAVEDTLRPNRLVIGVVTDSAENILKEVYAVNLKENTPWVRADLPTAELVKVAANSFLATKISFINAMAEVCEAAGGDVGLAEVGVDEVHTIIGQLAFVHQVVLDTAGAVLTQLAQQDVTGRPEFDHAFAHLRRTFFLAQILPFGRWLGFQTGAVNALEQWTFLAVGHLQQRRLSRDFIATTLEHLVVVVLVFTFQALLGNQRAVAALCGGAFDFQAQGRAFLECCRQLVQRALGIAAQLA